MSQRIFPSFRRQAASVHLQIIRQGLPVIENGEFLFSLELGLIHKIGHELFPGGSLRCNFQFLIEYQILSCHHLKQIMDHAAVKSAGIGCPKLDEGGYAEKLTGALIGIVRASRGNEHLPRGKINSLIIESLFASLTNVNFDNESLGSLLERAKAAKLSMVPDCFTCASSCGRTDDYDMQELWNAQEDIRSCKFLVLY